MGETNGMPVDQPGGQHQLGARTDRLRAAGAMRVHETLLRGYLAHGSVVRSTRSPDEPRVRAALSDGVRELITASGGVRSEDEYRYLIGTA